MGDALVERRKKNRSLQRRMDSEADKDAAAIEASRSPPKPASRAGPTQAEADAQKKASTCVCVVC